MHHPYISGPMSSYDNHNFPAFFDADHKLREFGYEPINPAAEQVPRGSRWSSWEDAYAHAIENGVPWTEYIRRDLAMVLDADGIIMLRGWDKSKGACLEVVTGLSIGLPLFHYVDNHAVASLELYHANADDALSCALHHLLRCGTTGVKLTSNGHVKYA